MSDNTRELVAMLAAEVADLAHAMGRRANTRAAQRTVEIARGAPLLDDLAPATTHADLLAWGKSMSGGDTSHMIDDAPTPMSDIPRWCIGFAMDGTPVAAMADFPKGEWKNLWQVIIAVVPASALEVAEKERDSQRDDATYWHSEALKVTAELARAQTEREMWQARYDEALAGHTLERESLIGELAAERQRREDAEKDVERLDGLRDLVLLSDVEIKESDGLYRVDPGPGAPTAEGESLREAIDEALR